MANDRQVIVLFSHEPRMYLDIDLMSKPSTGTSVPSEAVKVRPGDNVFKDSDVWDLAKAFSTLTTNSRVYVIGHTSWQTQKIEQYDGKQVAGLFIACGMPAVTSGRQTTIACHTPPTPSPQSSTWRWRIVG